MVVVVVVVVVMVVVVVEVEVVVAEVKFVVQGVLMIVVMALEVVQMVDGLATLQTSATRNNFQHFCPQPALRRTTTSTRSGTQLSTVLS